MPWRRKWQPSLVFLSEKFHGQEGPGVTKSQTQLSMHTHLCLKQVLPTIADAVTASGFQQTVLWPASCFLHLCVSGQVLWPQHVLCLCNEARCAGESHPWEQSSANEGKELSIKTPHFSSLWDDLRGVHSLSRVPEELCSFPFDSNPYVKASIVTFPPFLVSPVILLENTSK